MRKFIAATMAITVLAGPSFANSFAAEQDSQRKGFRVRAADDDGERKDSGEARTRPAREERPVVPERPRMDGAEPRNRMGNGASTRPEGLSEQRGVPSWKRDGEERLVRPQEERAGRIDRRAGRQENDRAASEARTPRPRGDSRLGEIIDVRPAQPGDPIIRKDRVGRDLQRQAQRDAARRDDRREWSRHWREDRRYDWRGWRERHRSVFRLGVYADPYGYQYRRWMIGWSMRPNYYRSTYWISDPWRYRLPEVYGPYRWVRYYDDAVLVNSWTGEVVDVIYNFFW